MKKTQRPAQIISMKKVMILVLASQCLGGLFLAPFVNAQTTSGASAGASGYGYANPTTVVSSGPAIIVSSPPIISGGDSGFLQFNNLTVESVSGSNPPAEIIADYPMMYPMMGAASGGAPMMNTSAAVMPAASSVTCFKFDTQNSTAGHAVSCPKPPTTSPAMAPTTQTQTGAPAPANAPSQMIYPQQPYPGDTQAYRIEVDRNTRLMLRDRTVASLGDFSSGDQINVFGYYNDDGSIQAYLIRDTSKPTQDEFLQLNNVQLVSISNSTNAVTLVVAQSQGYPCYGFGTGASMKQSIACPMGIQATTNSSALQNVSVPQALMPSWQALRKYVIAIDAQTVILDNNRTNLLLSDLRVGDQLNVYGDTTDNGQTLKADIVRDLSIPATPSTYAGTVTQLNTDGSFVVQTSDGQTITVQNPIRVGATIQLSGLLDRIKNILSQVSSIYFGENGTGMPPPPLIPATSGAGAPTRALTQ